MDGGAEEGGAEKNVVELENDIDPRGSGEEDDKKRSNTYTVDKKSNTNEQGTEAEGTPKLQRTLTFGGLSSTSKVDFSQLTKDSSVEPSYHSIGENEKSAAVLYVNYLLKHDVDLEKLVPLNPNSFDLCDAIKDGVLLCKLYNALFPECQIPKAHIRTKRLSTFTIIENHNIFIEHCKKAGCMVVNIGPRDLSEGQPHLVFGLVWQLIKLSLMQQVEKLMRQLGTWEEGETAKAIPLLLRWANGVLASSDITVSAMGDFRNSIAYGHLLHVISPQSFPKPSLQELIDEEDSVKRATKVIAACQRDLQLHCFVTPADVVTGAIGLNMSFLSVLCIYYLKKQRKKKLPKTVITSLFKKKKVAGGSGYSSSDTGSSLRVSRLSTRESEDSESDCLSGSGTETFTRPRRTTFTFAAEGIPVDPTKVKAINEEQVRGKEGESRSKSTVEAENVANQNQTSATEVPSTERADSKSGSDEGVKKEGRTETEDEPEDAKIELEGKGGRTIKSLEDADEEQDEDELSEGERKSGDSKSKGKKSRKGSRVLSPRKSNSHSEEENGKVVMIVSPGRTSDTSSKDAVLSPRKDKSKRKSVYRKKSNKVSSQETDKEDEKDDLKKKKKKKKDKEKEKEKDKEKEKEKVAEKVKDPEAKSKPERRSSSGSVNIEKEQRSKLEMDEKREKAIRRRSNRNSLMATVRTSFGTGEEMWKKDPETRKRTTTDSKPTDSKVTAAESSSSSSPLPQLELAEEKPLTSKEKKQKRTSGRGISMGLFSKIPGDFASPRSALSPRKKNSAEEDVKSTLNPLRQSVDSNAKEQEEEMKATQVEELVLSDEEVEFGNPAATPSKRSLSVVFSLNKKTPGKDPKTVREREKDTESKDAKEINRSNSLILKKMKTKTPGRGEDKPYESENPESYRRREKAKAKKSRKLEPTTSEKRLEPRKLSLAASSPIGMEAYHEMNHPDDIPKLHERILFLEKEMERMQVQMEAEIEKERVAREKAEQETLKARVERDKSFQELLSEREWRTKFEQQFDIIAAERTVIMRENREAQEKIASLQDTVAKLEATSSRAAYPTIMDEEDLNNRSLRTSRTMYTILAAEDQPSSSQSSSKQPLTPKNTESLDSESKATDGKSETEFFEADSETEKAKLVNEQRRSLLGHNAATTSGFLSPGQSVLKQSGDAISAIRSEENVMVPKSGGYNVLPSIACSVNSENLHDVVEALSRKNQMLLYRLKNIHFEVGRRQKQEEKAEDRFVHVRLNEVSGQSVKSGFILWEHREKWKRVFVLVGFFYVYIFKSDSSTEKEIKRIPLYDAELDSTGMKNGKKFSFAISTQSSHKFVFACEAKKSFREWCDTIQNVIVDMEALDVDNLRVEL